MTHIRHRPSNWAPSAMAVFLSTALVNAPFSQLAAQEAPREGLVNAESGGKWVRTSEYVTVRDGTRLAIDVIRPAVNGVPVEKPLPIVLQVTPYQRALIQDGKIISAVDDNHLDQRGRKVKAHMAALISNDVIVASLDIRGRGASFGKSSSGDSGTDQDRADIYDVVEWLAAQPYSNNAVGMAGCSYVGRTAMWAATAMPPHLKALAPTGVPLDNYESVMRPGGVKQYGYFQSWDNMMQHLAGVGVPVDADRNLGQLNQAIAEHKAWWPQSGSLVEMLKARPFRDSQTNPPQTLAMEYNYVTNFRMSQLPVLHVNGWRDLFPQDVVRWYQTIGKSGNAQRMVIGPWYHCEWYGDEAVAQDHVRWFQRYLGGQDNGVENDPKIRYFMFNAPPGKDWKTSNSWPIIGTRHQTYYFSGGTGGTPHSINGGRLSLTLPADATGQDNYTVDYTVTTQGVLNTRWNIPPFGTTPKLDTSPMDRKSITYTSDAFRSGTEFTGAPVLRTWVRSSANDADFYAYVSVVNEDGSTMLMTDGVLRASNRKLREAPFENGGLPWHSSMKADLSLLTPGEPALLEFALFPTSFWVKPGQRIRVTLNNFDKDGFDTPQASTPPNIEFLRDKAHPSSISLPKVGK